MFVFTQFVNAQVQVKYNPSGEKLIELIKVRKSKTNYSIPVKALPSFDVNSLLEQDKKYQNSNFPVRYGKEFKVNWSISNSGKWEDEGDNKIWRLKVNSKGAYSLAFQFNKFHLPDDATFLIYNEEESFMYGPLTAKNNKKHGRFSTGPIQGESIVFEIVVPMVLQEKVKLQISEIIHGYKNLFVESTGYGTSESCNINVVCRSGWDDESDAVARMINGIWYGSGALVNNTANDYTPYFLTAFHNVDVNKSGGLSTAEIQALSSCQFQFQYKSSTCSTNSNSGYTEFEGADLISHWDSTDFILLELDDSPVGDGDITYLGWDNRNNTPTSVVCIHHPSGDVMKYSYDNESPTLEINNTHWFVDDWHEGTTEGGSSGSPLFDQNSRVIGQDHAGDGEDPCDADKGTYFGCFHESWDGDGTDDNQLENWLDPNTTNDNTTNLLRSPSITVPDIICYSGHTVSIQNPPSGVTITWGGTNVSYPPNGNTGTSVTVSTPSSSTSGNGTVTASFTVNSIQHTITHPVWVGAPDPGTFEIWIEEQWDQGNSVPKDGDSFVLCEGVTYAVYMDFRYEYAAQGIIDTEFEFDFDYTIEDEWLDYVHMTVDDFYGDDEFDAWVNVTTTTNCGTYYNFIDFSITNGYCSSGYYMMISPNPTTGETTLSIESTTEATNLKSASTTSGIDNDAEWELEIYSPNQALKEKRIKLKGNSTTIQTQGWKEGVYVVRVKYKEEILTGKLVVKK